MKASAGSSDGTCGCFCKLLWLIGGSPPYTKKEGYDTIKKRMVKAMDRDERSYKRYKQYRRNKYRYEQEQIMFPIAVILGLALFIRYWYVVIAIAAIILALIIFRKVRKKNVTKSTETGYINKHNQRNNGCTYSHGTDYNQKFYSMECLSCGHKYKANGTDIWQRKCPQCQGGKP